MQYLVREDLKSPWVLVRIDLTARLCDAASAPKPYWQFSSNLASLLWHERGELVTEAQAHHVAESWGVDLTGPVEKTL